MASLSLFCVGNEQKPNRLPSQTTLHTAQARDEFPGLLNNRERFALSSSFFFLSLFF